MNAIWYTNTTYLINKTYSFEFDQMQEETAMKSRSRPSDEIFIVSSDISDVYEILIR